jgi:hypothetical protein
MEEIIFYGVLLILLGGSIFWVRKIRKEFDEGININEEFSLKEKLLYLTTLVVSVMVSSLWGLVIASSIFYYGLKGRVIKKAKFANNTGLLIFILTLIYFFGLGYLKSNS